jgi:hypothetical protein
MSLVARGIGVLARIPSWREKSFVLVYSLPKSVMLLDVLVIGYSAVVRQTGGK